MLRDRNKSYCGPGKEEGGGIKGGALCLGRAQTDKQMMESTVSRLG